MQHMPHPCLQVRNPGFEVIEALLVLVEPRCVRIVLVGPVWHNRCCVHPRGVGSIGIGHRAHR